MAPVGDNVRGALLMIAAMVAFTVNDACLKGLSGDLPLMQALFLRGLAVTPVLALWAWARGGLRLSVLGADRRRLALRTAAEIAAAWFYLTAVYNMPLANVASIHQATPLMVTLAALLFLGEPVGWRRLTAIAIGFVGVLLIVRPGTSGFTIYSIYALGAVVTVVVRDLVTRRMSAGLPSHTVALVTSIGVTVFAGAMSLATPWRPVGGETGMLLAGASGSVLVAYVLSISAMRVGEIAVVAPFRYTSLLVAMVIGVFAFGEVPAPLTLLGAAIVVATGLFSFFRENVRGRRTRPARSPEARTGDPGTGGRGTPLTGPETLR